MDNDRFDELIKRDEDHTVNDDEQDAFIKSKEQDQNHNQEQPGRQGASQGNGVSKGIMGRLKGQNLMLVLALALGVALIVLVTGGWLATIFFGISGGQSSSTSVKDSMPAYNLEESGNSAPQTTIADESGAEVTNGVAGSEVQFDPSKIIYTGNISLYTDDYQGTFLKIRDYAVKLEGFVQESNSSYIDSAQNTVIDSGYMSIRVPAEKFGEAMEQIQEYGSPVSSGTNSTNISQQYQDIKGQLDSLKIQEERLVSYLTKAGNITDMLAIESELNRVRTEIDSRTTIIKNWDKEVAYSTIYVSITEKEIATGSVKSPFSDMLQKISEGFITSINLLLNMLAGLIVWVFRLIPFAVVLGAGYFIYTRIRKKK